MLAPRVILIEKDLETIIVPILHEGIAVGINQDVVNDNGENVDLVRAPYDLVFPLEVVG
jgi:hypothetical protein